MPEFINQSTIPRDNQYPERHRVPDNKASWDIEYRGYEAAPIYPEFGMVRGIFLAQGVDIPTRTDLRKLGMLSNKQAQEAYGERVVQLRHPLGRTGITGPAGTNGYEWLGPKYSADLAMVRQHPSWGREIALIENRGKWHLPGGFEVPKDEGNITVTALREGEEETGLDFRHLAGTDDVTTLFAREVKPQSSRSTDYGWIENQVELIRVVDYAYSETARAGSDADKLSWFNLEEVEVDLGRAAISPDHYIYARRALS
jgi:8-oxo-dGTP pyrophosphatase MutT (NUDIX family)